MQHPSPIFWKRATNWDTWSFVWELLMKAERCGDSSFNSLTAWGTRPLGQCGGSVAGGPASSPSGHPLLMCRMAPILQGVIAAGWCRWCWSLRETRPRDFPRCFHHLLEKHTEGRVHREWNETAKKRPQSQHLSRVQIAIGYSDRSMTRYIHINTRIVVCAPRKDGLENGKREGDKDLMVSCFTGSMLFSPLSVFYFLFLVSRLFRCAMNSSPVSRCQSCPAVSSPVFE